MKRVKSVLLIGAAGCFLSVFVSSGAFAQSAAHGPDTDPSVLASVTASSTLEDYSGFNYTTMCLQDFNSDTAWVEGVPGDGIGETLTYSFREGTVLTGGVIYTGYQKSEYLLHANGAPNALTVESGDRKETLFLDSYADAFLGSELEGYQFWFEDPIIPENGTVTVTITSVRPGWKYQDTCISELRFCGYSEGGETGTTDPSALYLSEGERSMLSGFSFRACREVLGDSLVEDTVWADSLTARQQAFLLYWYQYSIQDVRIGETWDDMGILHMASTADLETILQEMFGENLREEALSIFLSDYADHLEGDTVFMSASGDFGDAGQYYFVLADEYWMEGDLIAVRGRVMGWNQNMESYVHQSMYTAYFAASPSGIQGKNAYCLDHVTIGQ